MNSVASVFRVRASSTLFAKKSQPFSFARNASSIFQTPVSGAPNIINSLKRDHAEFGKLYSLYRGSNDVSEKNRIANELIRGLSIHDAIEDRFLYPEVEAIKE